MSADLAFWNGRAAAEVVAEGGEGGVEVLFGNH